MDTNKADLDKMVEMFKLFGNRLRLDVILTLSDGAMSVGDLAQALDVDQSTLSQQLKTLRYGGYLQSKRKGQKVYYSLYDTKILNLIKCGVNM